MSDIKDLKNNKRADLLQVALTLFSERGYNGTSVQEIVNLAGVSKPTLYYFFKNKQGIYAALWQEYFVPFYEMLQKIAVYEPYPQQYEKDVFPQLCTIAQKYYDFAKNEPIFYRLMLSLQFSPEDAEGIGMIQQLYGMKFKVIKTFFDQAAEQHGNLQYKTELISKIFVADVYSGIEANVKPEEIVKLFMHGIF
jgi:TetR/AcrR family transcriptional regulator